MPLDPEEAKNVDRYFTCVKSLNDFDRIEIRNIVGGQLNPTVLERQLTLNYHRAAINIEFLLTIKDSKQFQVITSLTRTVFELAVELKLLATMPNAGEKAAVFSDIEKLSAAKKIIKYKQSHPQDGIKLAPYEAFITTHEKRLTALRQSIWPNVKQLSHWSEMNLKERVGHLGGDFERIYSVFYPQLSWYVHSGATGLATLTAESFASLCGVCFTILVGCYASILDTIVDAFGIMKADEKIKKKIDFAKVLPFTDSDEEVERLRRGLLS